MESAKIFGIQIVFREKPERVPAATLAEHIKVKATHEEALRINRKHQDASSAVSLGTQDTCKKTVGIVNRKKPTCLSFNQKTSFVAAASPENRRCKHELTTFF